MLKVTLLHRLELTTNLERHSITSVEAVTDVISSMRIFFLKKKMWNFSKLLFTLVVSSNKYKISHLITSIIPDLISFHLFEKLSSHFVYNDDLLIDLVSYRKISFFFH